MDINEISFPDEKVIGWSLQEAALYIRLSGAYLHRKIPEEVIVRVSGWYNFEVRKFHHEDGSWSASIPDSDYPKELCEFEAADGSLVIRGFGTVSGKWVEWKFEGVDVNAELAASNNSCRRNCPDGPRPELKRWAA